MLRATAVDAAKIEAAVRSILAEANEADRGIVVIHNGRFCEELKLSQLKKINFADEVHDVLDGTAFAKEFGNWIYHELDRGDYLFVRLTKPGQSFGRMDLVLQGLAVMIDPATIAHRMQSWKSHLPAIEGGGIPVGQIPVVSAHTSPDKSQI